MKEKIIFYGQDFSPIAEATAKDRERKDLALTEEIGDHVELTYYGRILEQFLKEYQIPKQYIRQNSDDDPDDDSDGNLLYSSLNGVLYFGKWVGVFRRKNFVYHDENAEEAKTFDITLEIRCRFDEGKQAFFLAAMLFSLTNEALPKHKLVNTSFDQVMDIFLLFIFKNQLAEAAKKGIFRKYQRFENNGDRLHGAIDIARHIRENMGLNSGRIAYNYRELTANNPVNHLILAAYKRLREKFPTLCETAIDRDESVYSTLNMLQTELGYSKTNTRSIVKENLRPITHPYFSEYEDLRNTCLKILRDESVWIFDAECSEETQSLCVDVTWLWEQFLERHLREQLEDFGLELTIQGIDGRGMPIFDERKKPCAEPDFVFWPGGQRDCAAAILDAKFKRRWDDFFCKRPLKKGASRAIDADINKCIRDMVVFRAPRTGVIFPAREEGGGEGRYHEEGHIGIPGDVDPIFDMVRVPVPEAKPDFEEWYQALESAVDRVLKDYLQKVAAPSGPAGQS